MHSAWQITPVGGDKDLAAVRALLEEYWGSFGFTPCFQNFGDELAGLILHFKESHFKFGQGEKIDLLIEYDAVGGFFTGRNGKRVLPLL